MKPRDTKLHWNIANFEKLSVLATNPREESHSIAHLAVMS